MTNIKFYTFCKKCISLQKLNQEKSRKKKQDVDTT